MFFHHYRVDSKYLIIDLNRIEILRKRHEARTEAMIAFLENNIQCRERVLLTYFGEKPQKDCGHCDVCKSKTVTAISAKDLKKELLGKIPLTGSVNIQQLISGYPAAVKEQAVDLIRTMIDNRELQFRNDHLYRE